MVNTQRNTKQIVFLGLLVALVVLFLAGLMIKGRPQKNVDQKDVHKVITSGDRAPDFRLPAPDSRIVGLSDLRGKVVMVHFWATWCPPCVEEMPTLDKLYRTLKGTDFEMLAVSVNEEGAAAVIPFMQGNRLNIPVFLDPERTVAARYGTYKFPETYIIDRQGIVRYKAIGPKDWTDPEAVRFLQDMIAAK